VRSKTLDVSDGVFQVMGDNVCKTLELLVYLSEGSAEGQPVVFVVFNKQDAKWW